MLHKNTKDLTGKTYGRLKVIGFTGIRSPNHASWLCQCECGNFKDILGVNLRSGHTKSCGCLTIEALLKRSRTHGMTRTTEYTIWQGMMRRCYNKKDPAYPRYGGSGLTVCNRWRTSFTNFFKDMGPRPSIGHSIDRKKNSKGYSPGNCRWATRSEQARNMTSNRIIEAFGKKKLLIEWSEEFGVSIKNISHRISRGVPAEAAISEPLFSKKLRQRS